MRRALEQWQLIIQSEEVAAKTQILSSLKEISKIATKDQFQDEVPVHESKMDDAIKKKYFAREKLNRREERYLWFNGAEFEVELVKWVKNVSSFADDRITKIILKSWDQSLPERKLKHFNDLNDIIKAPKLLNHDWTNLLKLEFLRDLSRNVGASIIDGDSLEVPLNYSLCELLVALFTFEVNDSKNLEDIVTRIKSSRFMNILDIKNGTYSISQAYFLGAHVKYCRDGETRTLYVDTFLNSMRRFLDDPRSVTSGWSGVEKVEPEGVEGWRRILNEEDVSFFFDKLSEIHRDRKEFWLRYIKSAQRVFLLIDTPKKRELKTIYSKDEKLSAAVSRLFTFRSDRKSEQYLLIMTFRDHIFVEGSNTGFGCQLYDRNLFEKKFKSSFYENQSENVIKDSDFSAFRGIASGRIKRLANHDSGGRWVRSFESELAALGVFPDVGGSSAHQGQFKKGGFSGKINLPKEDDLARELASASTDNFESILNRHGFATVNKTATKGRLWVYHHPRLPDLKVALESYGITLVESPSGSMSTGHKRAWYFAEG